MNSENKYPPSSASRQSNSIHVAALSVGLRYPGEVANSCLPGVFDEVVNAFQKVIQAQVEKMQATCKHEVEVRIVGTSALILFFDLGEIGRNRQLDESGQSTQRDRKDLIRDCQKANEALAYHSLKAAINLKNLFLIEDFNLERVRSHLLPYDIDLAIHYGRGIHAERVDGTVRLEGYVLEMSQHIRSLCFSGEFSQIMLSRDAHNILIRAIVKHTQLQQRLFFVASRFELSELTSSRRTNEVFELKFYHRIGIHTAESTMEQYAAAFKLDPNNIWAYYQLIDYFTFVKKDWSKAYELAKSAQLISPGDEKVWLDLAKYYEKISKFDQAKKCADEALKINDRFDLVYELLAVIACKEEDYVLQAEYIRQAVKLCPDSPVNNFNLGLALLMLDQQDEGYDSIRIALRACPELPSWPSFRESLSVLRKHGKLPELLTYYLEELEIDSALIPPWAVSSGEMTAS